MITSTETADTEVEVPESGATELATIGTEPTTDKKLTNSESEGNEAKAPGVNQMMTIFPKRKATGPRTAEGKSRSKYNALKHGILCRVVLLNDEPLKEFNSLLNGFRDDLRPEGQLEGILVEKLASLVWRYRRMLIAERAEIQKGTKYSGWDEFVRKDPEAAIFLGNKGKGNPRPGLILGIENPVILARCVEQLQLLRRLIETRGFDQDADLHILKTVYGDSAHSISQKDASLDFIYLLIQSTIIDSPPPSTFCDELSEPEPAKLQQEDNREGVANFLEILQKELKELKAHAELLKKVAAPMEQLEADCFNVPEGPRLDRILRYEASLDRAFDRTLNQLERLQRIRRGQPVLPPIKIETT